MPRCFRGGAGSEELIQIALAESGQNPTPVHGAQARCTVRTWCIATEPAGPVGASALDSSKPAVAGSMAPMKLPW